jgi:hypothetical protein
VWLLAAAAALPVGGCASPELVIDRSPAAARLFLDGRLLPARPSPLPASGSAALEPEQKQGTEQEQAHGEGPERPPQPGTETTRLPLPYYGTTTLTLRPPVRLRRAAAYDATRLEQTIVEPFSPWLFPLDFVLEALTHPFAGAARYTHQVAIALEPRPAPVGGSAPRDDLAIRERAEAARLAR